MQLRYQAKMYPDVCPDVRAFAVALWLSRVTGLAFVEMVPDDTAQLPEPRFVRQLLGAEAARIRRSALAREHGAQVVAKAMVRRMLKALHPDAREAYALWPPTCVRTSEPASDGAGTIPQKVFADAQRAIRARIATGELPASLLATSMEPRKT